MKKENLEKSIMLMGPSCVGKSLITSKLSERLNMPILSLDDLFCFIDMEQDGLISPSPKKQSEYIRLYIEDIKKDKNLKETLTKEYKDTQIQLIHEFIDLYNYYNNLVGPLKDFYSLNDEYYKSAENALTTNESLYCLKDFTYKVLQTALTKIDQPIIIDPPAPFGWEAHRLSFAEKFRLITLSSNINPYQLDEKISNFIKSTKTVLLEPGLDYNQRNAVSDSKENNALISSIEDFYDNANIVISTNELFYNPDNKWLQQRSWMDAREYKTKENLKNKSEINNICDQIICGIDELEQSKDY